MLIDVRSTLTPAPHLWIIIADDNLYHHVSVDEFRDALCYAAAAGSGLTTKEPATANHPMVAMNILLMTAMNILENSHDYQSGLGLKHHF